MSDVKELSERDAYLRRETAGPEVSQPPEPAKGPWQYEDERRAQQEAERLTGAQAREVRRRERGLAHVLVVGLQVAGRRIRLEVDDKAPLELGRVLAQLVDAARDWSRWAEEVEERRLLAETEREFVTVKADGKRVAVTEPVGRDRAACAIAEYELKQWGGALGVALQNLVACGGLPYQPVAELEAALAAEIRRQQVESKT